MKKISFLLLIVLSFMEAYAQKTEKKLTYLIQIVDGIKQIQPNAQLTYQNTKSQAIIKASTDAQGNASVSLVQGQVYELKIVKDGVEYKMQPTTVPLVPANKVGQVSMIYTIQPPQKTIAAFDRMGEENAFAVLARAQKLSAEGKDIINLGIGQPDFQTPENRPEWSSGWHPRRYRWFGIGGLEMPDSKPNHWRR